MLLAVVDPERLCVVERTDFNIQPVKDLGQCRIRISAKVLIGQDTPPTGRNLFQ